MDDLLSRQELIHAPTPLFAAIMSYWPQKGARVAKEDLLLYIRNWIVAHVTQHWTRLLNRRL
jgi:hypothetical protein